LQKVVLTYSLRSGSSVGVREFVSDGLMMFAEQNPSVDFETKIRPQGHPFLVGTYRNGYRRPLPLRNADKAEVLRRFLELRNTLGHRVPPHNEISIGVVRTQNPSVQGVWKTPRTLYGPRLPRVNGIINENPPEFRDIVQRLGTFGAYRLLYRIMRDSPEEKIPARRD